MWKKKWIENGCVSFAFKYIKALGFKVSVKKILWGELIDKYKDINANSKTIFTDYAMLKLVLYSPHMFLLFCQSKVGVVNKFSSHFGFST